MTETKNTMKFFLIIKEIKFLLILSLFCFYSLSAQAKTLSIATATSIENSGLLAYLLPLYTKDTNVEVEYTAVGTGAALKMGRKGEVDVVIVHAPDSEKKYMLQGYGSRREFFMFNDFILLGMDELKQTTFNAILKEIADLQYKFVSRGDNSGTHKKEQALWEGIGIDPIGEYWYIETGKGMGDTLKVAEVEKAFVLTDRATWIAKSDELKLKIVHQNDIQLLNPYSAIIVKSETQLIQTELANQFVDWLLSAKGQKAIASYKIKGQILFKAINMK